MIRYAIGNAERVMLTKNIGWLHTLGNDIDEPYYENKTGGPSIKVISILNTPLALWLTFVLISAFYCNYSLATLPPYILLLPL